MKTILIIDDDSAFREVLGEGLRQTGWVVLSAGDGEQGYSLAKAHRPEVVLCDLLMPRGNGFQFCQAVRSDASLRSTRIIVTTARDFDSDREAARAAGADQYLTKPVSLAHLLQVLGEPSAADRCHTRDSPQASASAAAEPVTRVRFWGVRGSIPTPGPGTVEFGGNTSCVEVRADGQIIILDAGTGLRLLGRELATEFEHKRLSLTMLLSHTHWDHIQGLPFFLPVYQPHSRLRILGYEGARHGLNNVLCNQMDTPYFPIGLGQVPANINIEELKELEFHVGTIPVRAFYANHPGVCVGYRLFTPHGSVAYFPDNEPFQGQRQAALARGGADVQAVEFAQREDEKMIAFLKGTDVLIMDTQYDCREYQQHVGWGHGCLDDVVTLALRSQVKRLYLFHHDPNHDDAKIAEMASYARDLVSAQNADLQVEAAKEGASLVLA